MNCLTVCVIIGCECVLYVLIMLIILGEETVMDSFNCACAWIGSLGFAFISFVALGSGNIALALGCGWLALNLGLKASRN